jgi:cyanophycin synthetase
VLGPVWFKVLIHRIYRNTQGSVQAVKILKLQTIQGPNYWSICRPNLIVMHLDLQEMHEVFLDKVFPGFLERFAGGSPALV